MFCVNCGKAYEPSYKFCNHCGYPVPSNAGHSEGDGTPDQPVSGAAASVDAATLPRDTHDESPTFAALPSLENAPHATSIPDIHDEGPTLVPVPAAAPPLEHAPYATFVSLVLGSTLFISVVVFNVADGFARNRWEATISTVVATVAAVLLARSARGEWRRVVAVEPETDAMLKRRHRRVLRNSAIIILFFFTSAAIVGAAIGQNRAEAVQLAADLDRMNTVGHRISKARSAVEATIPSYVQMYKTIEPDR